jgi:outer membrane protein TolC
LAAAFQRYRAARQQETLYRERLLVEARESESLVRLGYEKGDAKYSYTALLDTQRTLVQAKLAYVQILTDLWRSAADIAGLLQSEEFPGKHDVASAAAPKEVKPNGEKPAGVLQERK